MDYIDFKDLFTGLALAAIIGVVGWLTGFFRLIWRLVIQVFKPVLNVWRNQNYGGWSTNVAPDEIALALRNKNFIVQTNVLTRWWVTKLTEQSVQITDAYFLLSSPGQNEDPRHPCIVSRVLETGGLGPTTVIDRVQEIEVQALLFSDIIADKGVIEGSVVLVDQNGKEYRTETLKHYRNRAERGKGWYERIKARIREHFRRSA